MISRRAARRLIVLHPKQKIESELKFLTWSGTMSSKFRYSSGKGLKLNDVFAFKNCFNAVLKTSF
jgi:hypothetical protein